MISDSAQEFLFLTCGKREGFLDFKLLRKRNILNILNKINLFVVGKLSYEKLLESFQGWQAYAKWANNFNLRRAITKRIFVLQ